MSAATAYRVASSFGIALLFVALPWAGSAEAARSLSDVGDPRSSFPYWKCKDSCSCSPYSLSPPIFDVTATPGTKRTCFRVDFVGCNKNRSCCSTLLRQVHQLAIPIPKDCMKPTIMQVLVNGQEWSSWDTNRKKTPSGKSYYLRITNLKMNRKTFTGSEICVEALDVCDFKTQCSNLDFCKFAVSESSATRFCPVCSIPQPEMEPETEPETEPKMEPAATCELCEEVRIRSPLDVPIVDCKVIGDMMVDNLTSIVANSLGSVVEPFSYTCSEDLTVIKACGRIRSSSEVEATIQANSDALLYQVGFNIVLEDPADCSPVPKMVDVTVGGTCAVSTSWPFVSLPCGPF